MKLPANPGAPQTLEARSAAPAAPAPALVKPAQGELESRAFVMDELRVEGEKGVIEGHAAVFNKLSVPLWGFREKVRPGAFKKTIQEADIRALWNHEDKYVLGRKKAQTLELWEDDMGLGVRIHPPKAQWAEDLKESIRRKDVDQMSFRFRTIKDTWYTEDGETRRDLIEVHLIEVSPVTFPAYEDTDVGIRATVMAAGGSPQLLKAVLRMNQGEALSAEEVGLIRQYADSLRSRLPAPEPAADGHSGAGGKEPAAPRHSIAMLRRRLDLLETDPKGMR